MAGRRAAPAADFAGRGAYPPRLLLDLDLPRALWPLEAALPPPRLTFVPLGFLPELRFSPGRLPAAGPDGLRFVLAINNSPSYLRRYFSRYLSRSRVCRFDRSIFRPSMNAVSTWVGKSSGSPFVTIRVAALPVSSEPRRYATPRIWAG